MQLTLFSDYSLRVLLYLAAHRERSVPVSEIASAYGISKHHLVKVVQRLLEDGLISATRGRNGGVTLAKQPQQINIGAVVRATEPTLDLVECFDRATNSCPIDSACGLKQVLQGAQHAFLAELDRHTLHDFLPRAPALIKLWNRHSSGQV